MKTLIVEDEPLSAEHLANLLRKIDKSTEVVATLDSIRKSVEFLQQDPALEIIFMDIHLADGISFDIFSKILVDTPVIFTTAYDEYAIKAFKVNSIDYLLKPVGIEELRNALAKYKKLNGTDTNYPEKLDTALSQIHKQYKTRFMVRVGDNISSIKTEDIAHFIAEDGIVLLVNKQGKRYPVDYTLDALDNLLSPEEFFRINRKVLLHIESVQQVHTYFNSRLKIQSSSLGDEECIVSRERVADFKLWLDK
jgi:DNA-binding LytR/AlgR family response regulator